jgi:hypothetical protein
MVHFHHRLHLIKNLGIASPAVHVHTYRGPEWLARMPLSTIFPLLANATDLEALYLSAAVLQTLSGRGHIAARMLFQTGFGWMHKLGGLRVLDVIRLPVCIGGRGPRWATDVGEQREFRKEIAGALAMGQRSDEST